MSKITLRCSRGHTWDYSGSAPPPADPSTICPICAAPTQHTIEHASHAEPTEEVMPRHPGLSLEAGQQLPGFEILGEINRGGMGVIYKARQQGLNRIVALKVIAPERVGNSDAMKRFRREVQAAALLSHPNIVMVYHTDLDAPLPYLVMEFVSGIDLFRLVKQVGPLPITDACVYIQQTAQGLQHAFEQGLVHRDIKPANIMITPSPLDSPAGATGKMPRVKILDMGLARVTIPVEGSEGVGNLTQAGEFLGTPDYIAPEQAEDSRQADIRSDLYSLGGAFYFLLTGEVPFPATNLMQKLRRQLTEAPPSPAKLRPEIRPELDALIRKLLARDPAERYQTPAELIDAINQVLRAAEGGPASATGRVTPGAAAVGPAPSSHTTASSVKAHEGGVRAMSLSSDGAWLLSGGLDEVLRLWETKRMRAAHKVTGDVGPVESVALAPGAKWGASCSVRLMLADMVVQAWDLATGEERRRLKGHTDIVCTVAISPDGRRVAAGSADTTVRVWALDQPGSPSICLKGHTNRVTGVAFLPAGDSVLSGSLDGTVRLWDAKTGAAKGALNGQAGPINAVAFGGASKRIAVAGSELKVRQANGSFVNLGGHSGQVLCVAFSTDGNLVVSGGADHTVRLWRADNGEELRSFEGHTDKVHAVAISPDGKVAYSGSADGTIRRWPLV